MPLPTVWTPIAARPRQSQAAELLTWEPVYGSPLGVKEVRRLAAAGELIMASRHYPDRVELVVKTAAADGVRSARA